ncbi:head-tail connector protein [Chromobacterium haemolyticum]|uniref:head-tail connector protein n=1 Tax=Chromobacterium haemolyticum TaxID=394935 RepID=UPI0009DAB26C|nr:head-tail connector protein [Chromobacterium haemolyticum]OQS41825.1 hypothetical protein B0T39_07765 [Chromobacterium haemolyticum]
MDEILITPPPPLFDGLSLVRQQCRIDDDLTEDDALLAIYLAAAVSLAEHALGRCILPQVWERTVWGADGVVPLRPDVLDVERVAALDRRGGEQPVEEDWWLERGRRLICARPSGAVAVRVRFRCGAWREPGLVPEGVRQWVLLRVATAYALREALLEGQLQPLPRSFVDGLLDPWRA